MGTVVTTALFPFETNTSYGYYVLKTALFYHTDQNRSKPNGLPQMYI